MNTIDAVKNASFTLNGVIVNVKLLFDFLVPENLNSTV